MTDEKRHGADSPVSIDRRTFLTLTGAMSGPIAGCSEETKRTAPDPNDPSDPNDGSGDPDEVNAVEGKITYVFDRIEKIPLVADGEFVYDIENSVENVDYEEIVTVANDALDAAEDLGQSVDASEQTREYLQRAAKIGFLLVDQRFLLHRALLGGVAFQRAFSAGEYGRAVEVIDGSRGYLERLRANGGELEKELDTNEDLHLTLSDLDASSISSSLEVVLEILRWCIPVFEGFEYTATGMVVVQEGNQDLEANRYGLAREHFEQAQYEFSRAESAFNAAHGRGQPLEYLMPTVNDLRCIVPILETGYDELNEAFSELESGNEEEGLEIAREILMQLDREFSKCL